MSNFNKNIDSPSNLYRPIFDVSTLFAQDMTYNSTELNYQSITLADVFDLPGEHALWDTIKMDDLAIFPIWDETSVQSLTEDNTSPSSNNFTSRSSTPKPPTPPDSQQQSTQKSRGYTDEVKKPRKRGRKRKLPRSEKEQENLRARFLERNRVAASKCRDRKKKWIDDLEARWREAQKKNARLTELSNALLAEVGLWRAAVMRHEDCGHEDLKDLIQEIERSGQALPANIDEEILTSAETQIAVDGVYDRLTTATSSS